jgi:four helix bundle protein
MKIEQFEDLRCWQAARQLVKLVFVASKTGALARDFETKYQIKKAALSTMNNIAEGFGRFGVKDSIKFYNISQSSALEVKSMSYVLSDLQYLTDQQIEEIRSKADEARNRTLAYIKYQNGRLHKNKSTKEFEI